MAARSPLVPLVPLALLLATACSTSGGPAARQTEQRVDVSNSTLAEVVRIENRSAVTERMFAAPLESVWRELPAVYEELEIPLTTVQPAEGRMGTDGFRVSRIDGQRMSRFLDCGSSITGPNADEAAITMTFYTNLQPQAGGTLLSTDLSASGRLRNSGSTVNCSSRGRLEALIGERLQARLDGRSGGSAAG